MLIQSWGHEMWPDSLRDTSASWAGYWAEVPSSGLLVLLLPAQNLHPVSELGWWWLEPQYCWPAKAGVTLCPSSGSWVEEISQVSQPSLSWNRASATPSCWDWEMLVACPPVGDTTVLNWDLEGEKALCSCPYSVISGAPITLSWDEDIGRRLWFKCHRLLLYLLRFGSYSWNYFFNLIHVLRTISRDVKWLL